MQNSQARIAIIGAGPGGLTLAKILQDRGIRSVIFEREISPEARSQGGILDMKEDSGQIAIRAAGLEKEFLALARHEGQDRRLLDKTGKVLAEKITDDGDNYKPEIDRGQLRQIFLDSLLPNTVRWNAKLKSIAANGDGTHNIIFENGHTENFDLVVGADGAWSQVRPLLTDAKPEYAGVTFVEIHFNNVDEQHPAIAKINGMGSMFALSDNKGLIGQRSSNNHIRIYAASRVSGEWAKNFGDNVEQQRAKMLEIFSDWAPELKNLFIECEDKFILRPIHALPLNTRWESQPGLTLLGDAAHLMSPFSGMGANLAMLDGMDLANAICDSTDITSAIKIFETTMFERAHPAMYASAKGLNNAIASDAPRASLERFKQHYQQQN